MRLWAGRYFFSPFEQEEAVQEIWLMVHRVANAFEPLKGDLRPWLRAVASNRCKELLRARGRRPPAGEELDESIEEDAPGPEQHARNARVKSAVERFAASLPPDEGRMLELAIVQEKSHAEIAGALELSVRQCKYLKKKLLARAADDAGLRAALEDAS